MTTPANAHKALKRQVALAVGQLLFARAFVRETGQGRVGGRRVQARTSKGEMVDCYEGEQPIRFGIVGAADVEAFVAPFGRHVELECKTGKGELSDVQIMFSKAVKPFGVVFAVVRSAEEAVALVTRVHEEDRELARRGGFVVDAGNRPA